MKLINIILNATPTEAKNYSYKVEIYRNGNWKLAHTGKFFAEAGTTVIQLDLEDILYNYRFMGKNSIIPTLDVENNRYAPKPMLFNNEGGVIGDYWYNNVKVTSLDSPVSFTAVTKYFFFIPTQAFGNEEIALPSTGTYVPLHHHTLLPTLPVTKPEGFFFTMIAYLNPNSQVYFMRNDYSLGVANSGDYPETYYEKFNYTSGVDTSFYIDNVLVARTESCMSPYYLVWIANDGSMQCQPFLKTSKFSKTFTNKNRVDVRNAEWKISSTETGVWNMKSKTLTDEQYSEMGEMFESPYVLLLDMENSRMHYVNVTSKNYEEKRRTRKDRKPIFFEVEVTSAEHLRV